MARTDLSRAQERRIRDTTRRLAAELGRDGDYDGYAEWSLCEAIKAAAEAIGNAETIRIMGAEIMRLSKDGRQ